jgi:hypothetical protein
MIYKLSLATVVALTFSNCENETQPKVSEKVQKRHLYKL